MRALSPLTARGLSQLRNSRLHKSLSLRSKRFRFVSKVPFLGISLLRNQTETLARQAKKYRGRGLSVLTAPEIKREPKSERGGRGRGRKETLADKPLDFENLRSPANAAPDWLG